MNASHGVTENIRAHMGAKRISRAELGRRLGESEMWVGRRLNDQVPLTVDDLARIASCLDLPVSALLTGVAA